MLEREEGKVRWVVLSYSEVVNLKSVHCAVSHTVPGTLTDRGLL